MKAFMCLFFFIFLTSCIDKKEYFNTSIKNSNIVFSFYIPESFKQIRADTFSDYSGKKILNQYSKIGDTTILFSYSYLISINYPQQKTDLNYEYKALLKDYKSYKDSDLSDVLIVKINGNNFIQAHHIYRANETAYDELISFHNNNLVTFKFKKYNYFAKDSNYYKNVRDSIFNSVMMK